MSQPMQDMSASSAELQGWCPYKTWAAVLGLVTVVSPCGPQTLGQEGSANRQEVEQQSLIPRSGPSPAPSAGQAPLIALGVGGGLCY